MPLSAAERQRRCREKRKNNPEKHDEYRRKHLELYHAKKRLVKDMTPKEHLLKKHQWKRNNQTRRQRLKALGANIKNSPPSSPALSRGSSAPERDSPALAPGSSALAPGSSALSNASTPKQRERKQLKRDRAKVSRENELRREQIDKLNQKIRKHKKRLSRNIKSDVTPQTDDPSAPWTSFDAENDPLSLMKEAIDYENVAGNCNDNYKISPNDLHPFSIKYATSNDSETPLLGIFTREDGDTVRCDFCDVTLAADSAALKDHLTKEHPKILDGLQGGLGLESDDYDNTEPQHEDEIYTDLMYEEEVSTSTKNNNRESVRIRAKKINSTKKAKLSRLELDRKRLHGSSSSDDDEQSKTKPASEDDQQLNNFVNYVTSLLKPLPKEVSLKLQMEIISMIMKEKMKVQDDANAVKVVSLQDLANMSQVLAQDNGNNVKVLNIQDLANMRQENGNAVKVVRLQDLAYMNKENGNTVKVMNLQDYANMRQAQQVQEVSEAHNISRRKSAVFVIQNCDDSETAAELIIDSEMTENKSQTDAAPILAKLPDLN